jgi:eukaryotic-like serine/threonine-protein kinase
MNPGDSCPSCGAALLPGDMPTPVCVQCALGYALADAADSPARQPTLDDPGALPSGGGRMGPYLLRRVLGEGGMGIVWEADQEEPVRRRVALKCIRIGMDSGQFLARFESERQALALMSHPNIARAFDADCTPEGQPYFAMELVDGPWITTYCDAQRLDIRRRLELFVEVCQGIQHAHQRGVIHRDIKPSNILVQVEEGRPVPKIIDFGLAKAMGAILTDRTLVTRVGQTIGTPEYMSPEQAGPAGFDVDTRTDVYALGVLLYELLTGKLPFEIPERDLDELRRRIREDEPTRPSAKLVQAGSAGYESARQRGAEPASLARSLRGDLDWIVLKTLAKDRARRYASPGELAADIGRYLANEPVIAGAPSAAYRARKFVRRHRFGVTAAALAFLGVVAFGITTLVETGRIARERDRANAEATKAQRVSGFLEGLFQSIDPNLAKGKEVTVREVLDAGRLKIQKELESEPDVEVPLLLTLGRVYRSLAVYPPAHELIEEAVRKSRAVKGPNDRQTLSAENNLVVLLLREGRTKEAQVMQEELLARCRTALGENDQETLSEMNNLGAIYLNTGHNKEAEATLREALEANRRAYGPESKRTLILMNNLAHACRNLFRYKEAESLCRKAIEGQKRVLGPDDLEVAMSMDNLAGILNETGRYAEAEQMHRKIYAIRRRVLGEEHDITLESLNGLADALNNQGRYAEVEGVYRQLYEILRRKRGDEDIRTLDALDGVASALLNQGNYAEGGKLERQIAEAARKVAGPDDRRTLGALWGVALAADAQGRYGEARSIYADAFERSKRTRGAVETFTLQLEGNLAAVTAHLKQFDEAETLARDMLGNCRRTTGDTNPNTTTALYELARISALRGRKEEALDYLRQAKAAGNALVTENFLREKDFSSLHGNPEFERLIAAAKSYAQSAVTSGQ